MYAFGGVDFSQPGNVTILLDLGQSVGLAAGSRPAPRGGNSFRADLRRWGGLYAAVGAVDTNGVPTSACTNFGDWVFTQWMVIGNASPAKKRYRKSTRQQRPHFSNGEMPPLGHDTPFRIHVTKAGAVPATFHSELTPIPYRQRNGAGLPSGQKLYVAESGVRGFTMATPFVTNGMTYASGLF